jgi:hypothetical protein
MTEKEELNRDCARARDRQRTQRRSSTCVVALLRRATYSGGRVRGHEGSVRGGPGSPPLHVVKGLDG